MRLIQHTGESRFSFAALMNFVDFTVWNTSAAEFTNINAGGVDVPAGASVTATLTNSEILALAQLNGAVIMQLNPTAAELRAAGKALIASSDIDTDIAAVKAAETSGVTILREAAWAALEA